RVAPLPPPGQTAKYDLTLFVSETANGLECAFEFATGLFDLATVARWAGHFRVLLTAMVRAPTKQIVDLQLLGPAERRSVVESWNETRRDVPWAGCVHEQVARHALATPAAVAVSYRGEQLTYAELDASANQLAHHLRSLGAGPDARVGICLERGLDMVVGFLGVLKSGASYVPLDPEGPPERTASMVQDAGVRWVITLTDLRAELPPGLETVVCLDSDSPGIVQEPTTDPAVSVRPDHLAYCIYTSGSTGRPKGVAVPHSALANLIAWHRDRYELTPEARATQVAASSFDACGWELWPYLSVGARVVVVEPEARRSPEQLVDLLSREGITHCFLPTALAELALSAAWPPELPLQVVLTGGDRLLRAPSEASSWELINHYGPTECTVLATCGEVRAVPTSVARPAIGRPIANVQVYVLDSRGEPVPIGVPGELFVAGAGLARGYLGRPALTAEHFVPNPFGLPGSRMYATGDRARWRSDGQLDFLGRTDRQVKVRGVRIELGEVEAQVAALAGVVECAVTVTQDSGQTQLIAYVVSVAPTARQAWRQKLAQVLPAYMVPTGFEVLERLPLTRSGKVDHRALPAPCRATAASVRPRTDLERALVTIWERLLDTGPLGVHDDFFALGGQSLRAIEVTSRLRADLGIELPLRAIFDYPTVADLAEHVELQQWIASGRSPQPDPAAETGEI
ncbi:amino acid adenylation domain-containing protein, partial [Planctomycetota bacterium]|nr:amino acid adenylation domain-containing protein [Planctomycetota bacterium]